MNISGNTNTCIITANVQFRLSGQTDDSSPTSVITITDENGLDLANCFLVNTSIDTLTSTGVSTSESTSDTCENILIIPPVIVDPPETECLYTGVTFLETGVIETDGLILVTYSGGSTSLNVHPDCCTNIDSTYISEVGTEMYNVCRWRPFYDPTDCENYVTEGTLNKDEDGYIIFNKVSGDTTIIVPSIECCTRYDFREITEFPDGIRCKEKLIPVCPDYRIEVDVPDIGDVEFTVIETGALTTVVPTIECCTTEALSYREVEGGYSCYKALNPPTVSITLDSLCCEESQLETGYCVSVTARLENTSESGYVTFMNCDGVPETITPTGNEIIDFCWDYHMESFNVAIGGGVDACDQVNEGLVVSNILMAEFSNDFTSQAEACAGILGEQFDSRRTKLRYITGSSDVVAGKIIYEDDLGLTPYNGFQKWYSDGTVTFLIDNDGTVFGDVESCDNY
jgi:hypothetical protein